MFCTPDGMHSEGCILHADVCRITVLLPANCLAQRGPSCTVQPKSPSAAPLTYNHLVLRLTFDVRKAMVDSTACYMLSTCL
jgi:hypothetical protein